MSDEFKIGDEFEARVKLISPTTLPDKRAAGGTTPAWYVRSPDGMAYVVCEASLRAARRVSTVEETTRIGSIRTDYGTANIPEGARWRGGWTSEGLPVQYEDGRKRTIPWTLPAAGAGEIVYTPGKGGPGGSYGGGGGSAYAGPGLKLARYSASPTPMSLKDTTFDFEKQFYHIEHGGIAVASDGQPFVQITSGGMVLEGWRDDVWCTTKQAAIRLWYRAVVDYANERGGTTLIWSRKPEMQGEGGMGAPMMVEVFDSEHQGPRARILYLVYSRLYIPKA